MTKVLAVGGAAWAAVSVLAFLLVHPIIAAFISIVGAVVVVVAVLSQNWERHPTFEERELVRARKRKEKWAKGQAARDRDRQLWEAHQERKRRQAGTGDPT